MPPQQYRHNALNRRMGGSSAFPNKPATNNSSKEPEMRSNWYDDEVEQSKARSDVASSSGIHNMERSRASDISSESIPSQSSPSNSANVGKSKQKRHRRLPLAQSNNISRLERNNSSDIALQTFVNLDISANSSITDIPVQSTASTSSLSSEVNKGAELDDISFRKDPTLLIKNRSSSKLSKSSAYMITSSPMMLHLMRMTQGRMRGRVYLRKHPHNDWQSTHCAIRTIGSLSSEEEDTGALIESEIDDLRGVQVCRFMDEESNTPILHILSADRTTTIQLRPKKQKQFDSWFAAFLCWQAVLPHQKPLTRPPARPTLPRTIIYSEQYLSRGGSAKGTKFGKALLLQPAFDTSNLFSYSTASSPLSQSTGKTHVLCAVDDSGNFRIFSDVQRVTTPLIHIQLSQFPRSAIQGIDKSVAGQDLVLGIYPQYSISNEASSQLRPLFLAFDSKKSYETWYLLLKTFAQPELYGLDSMDANDDVDFNDILPGIDNKSSTLFRIESSLCLHINRAKLDNENENIEQAQVRADAKRTSNVADGLPSAILYCAEVLVDEQLKLRTKTSDRGVWYESHDIGYLPPYYSTISIQVVKRHRKSDSFALKGDMSVLPKSISIGEYKAEDSDLIGKVILDRAEVTELSSGSEQWLPIIGNGGLEVGEISVKLEQKHEKILNERAYDGICSHLDTFSNKLTLKIWRHIPLHLSKLAEIFLNVFQVSGRVEKWLQSLADHEIQNGASQSAIALNSKSQENDEALVDQKSGQAAIAEASILFRSNTLFTKALDFYMKRLGKTYLRETLSNILEQIMTEDLDCEVDPSKLQAENEAKLHQNWQRLLERASAVWNAIYKSASRCPHELRSIFRYIRDAAHARYGSVMPFVSYSSVSGFLFLRFFCAAVMTPQLFGLVKEIPSGRTNRTFLLIAKSLQGLANMTTFGAKEPWMSQMNTFCAANRGKFKLFLDTVCASPSSAPYEAEQSDNMDVASSKNVPVNSSAANIDEFVLDMYYMLEHRAREGLPSLPHLIDRPYHLAVLVNIWLDNVGKDGLINSQEENGQNMDISPSVVTIKTLNSILGEDDDLARFHASCQAIRHKIEDVSAANFMTESRQSLSSEHEPEYMTPAVMQAWVKIAEHMESAPEHYWTKEMPVIASPEFPPSFPANMHNEQSIRETNRRPGSGNRSEKSRRSQHGTVSSGEKGQRRSSDTPRSTKTKPTSKKKEPSPDRGVEGNTLRKLGWL